MLTAASAGVATTKKKQSSPPQSRQPNVIFILAEDMGLGDLACYGHPYARTPHLDRLAAEGTRFTRFYVAGATCNPSRSGFMSSRNPATLPNYNQDFGFPESHATITRLLHDAGYKTGHVGKWHIGPQNNSTLQSLGMDEVKVLGGAVNDPLGKDARVYQAGMDFIERHKDEPFYLNLWSHVAHSPVEPRETLLREFDNLKVKRSDFDRYMQKKFDSAVKIGGDNAIDFGMRRYLADLWGMDQMVGRLLDKLDELGIRDNTIIAFTADHGAAPIDTDKQSSPTSMMGWAGGLRGAKHDFFEGGLRVPFIVSWPGHVPQGKVNDASVVSALDWLPTICRLAGVPIDGSRFDGEDISKILLGEENIRRKGPLFWKFNREESDRAMIFGNYKLFASRRGDFSLFELDHDRAETENRINDEPEIAQEMKDTLLAWESTLPSQYCNFKNGCTTPLPFDSSARPTYVGPPKILLADDVPVGAFDEVSKEDSEVSIGFDGGESTNAPAEQDHPVSYDGEVLPNSDDGIPSIPTQKPPSVNTGGQTTAPNVSPTPPLRAPSASSGGISNSQQDNDTDLQDMEVDETKDVDEEDWRQEDEADASSAQEITQFRSFWGVMSYTSVIVLPVFWL